MLVTLLQTQQALDAQGYREVEARLCVFQFGARDLANPIETVAQRIGVDAEPAGGGLLLTLLEVCLQGGDQAAVSGSVVLYQRSGVAVREFDQSVVADAGQQTGQAELWDGHHLAPALEPGQGVQDGPYLPVRGGHSVGGVDGRAEADGHGESRAPIDDGLPHLQPDRVHPRLLVSRLDPQRQERDDAVRVTAKEGPGVRRSDHGGDPPQELTLDGLDRVLTDLARAQKAAEVVDVHHHHHVPAGERVAQVPRSSLRRRLVPVRALHQLVQEFTADTALDLGNLTIPDQGQGHYQRGLLDRHEGQLLVVRRVLEDGDHPQELVRGKYGGDDALAVHTEMRECGHLHGPASLRDLPQHALDLGVIQYPRRRAVTGDRLTPVRVGG